jgi:hypothetical protein
MTRGSRANLLTQAAARLQRAFEARRNAARAGFERLTATGAFRAPDHLRPDLQAELGLGQMCPLPLDAERAEAA